MALVPLDSFLVYIRGEKLFYCSATECVTEEKVNGGLNMKKETKLLACLSLALLVVLPFVATTIVNASGQESTTSTAGPFNRLIGWLRQRFGYVGKVQVSEEYKTKAITIATDDVDVKALLDTGYSVVGVRPIIQSSVDANGIVTSKATHAIVTLKNADAKSGAAVWVDMTAGRVLKIVTLTATVIDKS